MLAGHFTMQPTPGNEHRQFDHGRYEAVSLNTGTFYVRSTVAGQAAVQQTAEWVAAESIWDQEAFTNVMLRPSFLEYRVRCAPVLVDCTNLFFQI